MHSASRLLQFPRERLVNSSQNMQVQVVDQTTYPPKCRSFVGLDRQIDSSPLASFCTHTFLPRRSPPPTHRCLHPALPIQHCRELPMGASFNVKAHSEERPAGSAAIRRGSMARSERCEDRRNPHPAASVPRGSVSGNMLGKLKF